MRAGDYRDALRLAASFSHLGEHKADITRGWHATLSPGFYRKIGEDPDELAKIGLDAIRRRWNME